jgi:predicted dehydrogenase
MTSQDGARLRVGIVGTGFMGGVHARAIARSRAELVAVASSSLAEAEAAARRWGVVGGARSVPDVLTGTDIDAVHICTPNHLHASQVEVALKAGKHVICEKPLATNRDDAQRLVDLARERDLVAAVPYVYRFYGSVREARARIRRGDAGSLRLIHGSYLQDWLAGAEDTNWRVDPKIGGASRAFGDIGIHWCDLAEFLTGRRIREVVARMATPVANRAGDAATELRQSETEDIAAVLFTMDDGISGSLIVSQVSLGRKNRLWVSIDGENAAYVFDQESPEALWVGGRQHSTVVPRGSLDQSRDAAAYDRTPAGHPQGYQDCFDAFVADVYTAIAGQPPDGLPLFEDGLRSAVIVDAVLESARSGKWVEVAA